MPVATTGIDLEALDRRVTRLGSALDRAPCRAADLAGRRIGGSRATGGIEMSALRDGSRVVVQTLNHRYRLEIRNGHTWICGHPEICPRPIPVRVHGSSWGGSMLKVGYIGRGMRLEFALEQFRATVTTSEIVSVSVG